jgi:predicted nucleotidyltransferase
MTTHDVHQLAEIFRRSPGVAAAYLFGSAASGRTHPGSDLDLAVVPQAAAARPDKLELLTELTRAGYDNVDLVILATGGAGDVVLAYEAIAPNRMIYASPNFDRGAYYSATVRRYLDLQPYLKRQREAYRRKLEYA